jgi:hypothetical protein
VALQQINISVETMSLYSTNIYSKGKYMKIVKLTMSAVWSFFCSVGEARYAAELARNGKIEQAKKVFEHA